MAIIKPERAHDLDCDMGDDCICGVSSVPALEPEDMMGEYPEIKVLRMGQHAVLPYLGNYQCLLCRSVYPEDYMAEVPCPFGRRG